ncbi:MAG: ribosome assembly cofactor RimP [Flavobacteriales bacterium]|nr:ribosome assembly cofactor RimP [Flavobacteriales bacterium]
MITAEKVSDIIRPKLAAMDLFEVEVLVRPGNRISVAIDKDSGVTLDECTLVSRHIFENLDREVEDYELEVSSPGLTTPLKVPRQYMRRIGRTLRIILQSGDQFDAELLAADADSILVERSIKVAPKDFRPEKLKIAYTEIKQAKLLVKF